MAYQMFQTNLNAAFAAAVSAINKNYERINLLDKEEEDDFEVIATVQSMLMHGTGVNEKRVWRYPTSNHWWTVIYPNLPDDIFIQHFRIDRPGFSWLVNEVKDFMTTHDTRFRNAIEIERKVAASLKCLATTCDFLTVGALFGIGKSSVHKYFMQFINAMYQKVVPKVIQFPSHYEIRKMAADFEQMWGFPMAFSAIDGTHISFSPPVNLASDFHNYKGWSSVIAIAMCDSHGKAIWLKCGLPGRLSDSGAFKATKCYASFTNGQLLPSDTKDIDNQRIPYMVLGDSGFAMESWLMKPFTHHKTLTENQKIFNYRHSKARRTVENMFGRIKLRWRRLLRGLDVSYENAHKVISVAFALHNICESQSISIIPTIEEMNETSEYEERNPQPISVSSAETFSGVQFRDTLMNYFANQPNPWTGN